MKVLVTGSSGLIGSALIESLTANGHEAIRLLRTAFAEGLPFWDPENGVIDLGDVTGVDAVVHLAGYSIANGRWNERTKARILDSRVRGTKLLAEFFAESAHKPHVIVSASGVGAYGECGEDVVDERSEFGKGFLADVARQWEESTAPAVKAGIRVVNIRLGIVLSASGGALKKMLLPFKMGLGGVIGSGKQYMSWVSIDDVAKMIQYVMANDSMRGPVNLVSPTPVSNYEFTKTLGRALHRPTVFRMPAFVACLAFGEMAKELLLSSTRAMPKKLMDTGYQFRHSELEEAFKYLLGKADNS
jgi:uncharacterized protein (TIGR01777 family)